MSKQLTMKKCQRNFSVDRLNNGGVKIGVASYITCQVNYIMKLKSMVVQQSVKYFA